MTPLTERVERALRHHADALVVEDVPFDPAAPGLGAADDGAGEGGPESLDRPRRGRPRVLVPVAASVLVVALLAGLALAGGRDDGQETVTAQPDGPATTIAPPTAPGPPTDATAEPGPGLLAAAVPTDLQPVALAWGPTTRRHAARYQLLGRSDGTGGRILVVLDAGGGGTGSGTSAEVRGTTAAVAPSKEHPDTSTTIRWTEGADVQARVIGMGEAEAIAVLDGLAWRDEADHLAGFADPGGEGVVLVDEVEGGPVGYRQTEARYADAPGSVGPGVGRQLTVRAGDGGGEVAAIEARFAGAADADGRVTSYDPRYGTLVVAWPDGRHAWIDANATAVTEAELEAVADSIEPATADELAAVRAGIDARLGQGGEPVVSVELPVASDLPANEGQDAAIVEVRDGGQPVVCIAIAGAVPRCDPASEQEGVASLLVDGTWYVALARTDGSRISLGPPSPGADPVPVPGLRQIDVDGWHVELAAVPDDVDEVWVGTDLQSGNVLRPTS